jgi:ATP-dependent DNA ligase
MQVRVVGPAARTFTREVVTSWTHPTKEQSMTTMTATPTAESFTGLVVAGKLAQNAEAPKKNGTAPLGDGYVMEPKYDGWRILAHVHEDGVSFYSRSGKSYNGKLPKVEAELSEALPAGTWLDGEVCALSVGEDGKVTDNWHTAQSVLSKVGGHAAADTVTYMVFDILAHADIDARSLPYEKRRVLLEKMFDNHSATFDAVCLTATYPAEEEVYGSFVAAGFEGAVVKKLTARYASGQRGHGWTKMKPKATIEGVVMGFQPGKDGFAGLVGAVIFGQHNDNGVLVERGKCSGFDMVTRKSMTKNPEKWMGTVIEVAHEGVSIGATDSGRFRFPRWVRPRPDKSAAQVTFHDE